MHTTYLYYNLNVLRDQLEVLGLLYQEWYKTLHIPWVINNGIIISSVT
jgi:hypothetical protein